jgi:hypothetical protein
MERSVRALFQTRIAKGYAADVSELSALAATGADADAAAITLHGKLAQLFDVALVATATGADPQVWAAAKEEIQTRHEKSVSHLQAMKQRLLTECQEGLPSRISDLTSLLETTMAALQNHEKSSAIHGLPLEQATEIRKLIGVMLRTPLARIELPLHLATPGQKKIIDRALAMFEPVGASGVDHFDATHMKHCTALLAAGEFAQVLNALKLAQAHRDATSTRHAQTPGQGRERAAGLQESVLHHLFKSLPPATLSALAKAMSGEPFAPLLAAMKHIGANALAGQPLGREIAERHHELGLIRDMLGRALAKPLPDRKIKFEDAIRQNGVVDTLRDAFALLQLEGSGTETEIFAKTGPFRMQAQAMFDAAFTRDAQSAGREEVEINGIRITSDFAQAARRVPCYVRNPLTGVLEELPLAGKFDGNIVREIMEKTGATPAQMSALSKIYDADGRIDDTLCSPWSVLWFERGPVLPVLSAQGRRESDMRIIRDKAGNLKVRFTTELTGIARLVPFNGQRLSQPRAIAAGGNAKFKHDVLIAPDGESTKAQLRRDYDLQHTTEPAGRYEQTLNVADLLRNPDALSALAWLGDRRLAARRVELVQMIFSLSGIGRENTSNVLAPADGIVLSLIGTNEQSRSLGISAETRGRIMSALNNPQYGAASVVAALKAAIEEVAQSILDTVRARLAASGGRA